MAGPPPATIRVGNLRQTKTKPTGLLVAILMAQNSCLGGQPIRSFNPRPPNQRPTNQSKVTIHLASNNPAGGYKKQKGTRKPDARGAAAKAGNEEKRKKKRETEERKGRNGKQERRPSKRRRRRRPSSIPFNGELSRALSQSDNGDDEGQDGGSIERASDQASDQVTKPTNQASRQTGDLAMK